MKRKIPMQISYLFISAKLIIIATMAKQMTQDVDERINEDVMEHAI